MRPSSNVSALVLLALAGLAAPAAASLPASASLDDAEEALLAGRYQEAIEAFEEESHRTPAARTYLGWVEALRLTGHVEEALATVEAFEAIAPDSAALSNTKGELYYGIGRVDEARQAFERAISSRARDRLTAELNLAILIHEGGDTDDALRRFDQFIDVYNQNSDLSSEDLTAVALACTYLAVTDPQLLKDALRAFDEAAAADPANATPRILVGELFLSTYQSPEASESFQGVLATNPVHPEALLGLAKVKAFDGASDAMELAEKALETNPNYVEARAFVAEQYLALEDYDRAREEADKALDVNPLSPVALPILAAAELLSGNEPAFERVQARAFARNPRDAGFYNTLANIAVNNRLYQRALAFAQEAVRLDPASWEGYGQLGLNQLRLGDIENGRKNLELSFEGDPYNLWIKNTLDLLDTFPEYEAIQTPRFELFIGGDEAALLAPYFEKMAEEAYTKLAAQYEFEPETPIRIEVFSSHADFSVRTLGLPGLGALGVCFGPLVAVDSPSARPRGQFNWASTLWHELAHTVTLGVTDHKVPRWFSEGLSVLEERRAIPGWGDDTSLAFLAAFQREQLLPIAELNNGFMRPTYPQQIGISYYQASLVSEWIEREHGFQAVRNMLAGYREGLDTEAVFRKSLGLELDEFDELFEAYLKERFGPIAATLRLPPEGEPVSISPEDVVARAENDEHDFLAQLETGRVLLSEGKPDEAFEHLQRAKSLFPEYAEEGSPYILLSQIYEERGDLDEAARELQAFVDINENHYDAHVRLADLYESLNQKERAAGILERAIYIYPFEESLHRNLAQLYKDVGRSDAVILERRALLAMTTDRAQALYELALAYYDAGDRAAARRELLRALELAPGFREGLELLLKLQSDTEAQL